MTGTMHNLAAHQQRFARADAVLAGGVSATLRINMAIGHPIYMERADGPYLYDADGQRFIDFNLGNGAALLGHRHPAVQAAMIEAVERGLLTGSETEEHAQLAEMLAACIPSAERSRFSTAGTEAPMLAVRVARAYTGRPRILKFEGHFHGLYDAFMYNQKVAARHAGRAADRRIRRDDRQRGRHARPAVERRRPLRGDDRARGRDDCGRDLRADQLQLRAASRPRPASSNCCAM